MSAVDQYNFPNLSPRYGNAYLSHLSQTFNSTSTDVTIEDELDDLEDGSPIWLGTYDYKQSPIIRNGPIRLGVEF